MDDFGLYPSFAKRSKEVNRYSVETEETLLRREMRLPSTDEAFGYESVHASQRNMDVGEPAGLVGRHNTASVGLTHEMLPRPSQLMVRRRRDQISHRHAANVLQHIGDLRTRQRHINDLKGDRWWGATATETRVPQQFKETRNERHLGPTADFLFTGCEQVLDLAPGGNPMMSFVEGTAHRSFSMAPACATVNSGISAGVLRSDYDEMLFENIQLYH